MPVSKDRWSNPSDQYLLKCSMVSFHQSAGTLKFFCLLSQWKWIHFIFCTVKVSLLTVTVLIKFFLAGFKTPLRIFPHYTTVRYNLHTLLWMARDVRFRYWTPIFVCLYIHYLCNPFCSCPGEWVLLDQGPILVNTGVKQTQEWLGLLLCFYHHDEKNRAGQLPDRREAQVWGRGIPAS